VVEERKGALLGSWLVDKGMEEEEEEEEGGRGGEGEGGGGF